jgi:hypothetical protein
MVPRGSRTLFIDLQNAPEAKCRNSWGTLQDGGHSPP